MFTVIENSLKKNGLRTDFVNETDDATSLTGTEVRNQTRASRKGAKPRLQYHELKP